MKRVNIRAALANPVDRKRLEDAFTRSIKAVPSDGAHPVQAVTATITRILKFGTLWTVKLDCGCSRKSLSSDDLKREQLFIGKTVECKRHGTK